MPWNSLQHTVRITADLAQHAVTVSWPCCRDLEVLREKWRTFCDRVPSQPPPPPPRAADPGPKPQAHAASSAAKGSAEPDLAWEADSDWLLAACMEAERAESCAAADQPCDCSAGCDGAESLGSLPDWNRAGGRGSFSGDSFSREDQMSELPQCRASSLRAGSEGCIWASCVLDELSEADYLAPFRLSQEYQPVSEGCPEPQLEAGDLLNALDAELNWEEVIEEFMQPAVADEMSIIEQFMQPTGGEGASRADRDMYQYYMQRGQNAQRTAVSAGRA